VSDEKRPVDPEAAGLPGAPEEADGGEQQRQGLGHRPQRVAVLLTRLATTARSFLLYDPHNEAIHRFIGLVLSSLQTVLEEENTLPLSLQPFEIFFEGEPVYLNRDRERSLAFRLYRDGVRSMTFRKGFDWEELAKLLEILSIRYTGVNQREDDVVTLLWKARFHHLDVGAVEGIVPEDDEASEDSGDAPAAIPEEVDLPRPELPTPIGPSFTPVSEEARGRLIAEASQATLPDDCLSLLDAVRVLLRDPTEPLRLRDVLHVFTEVREFLLTEDHLPAMKRYLSFLWQLAGEEPPEWDERRHELVYDLLDACGDRKALRRLLRSVPPDERKLRPEVLEVLDRACPDPVAAVADILETEEGPAVRAVARQILEHYGVERLDLLQKRFQAASGTVASDLLRVIAGISGPDAVTFVARQSSHRDAAVQDEALWHLGNMSYSGAVGHGLFDAFRWTDPTRRSRVLGMIAATGDRRFLDLLAGYVEDKATELPPQEAAEVGLVLGRLGGDATLSRWQPWLHATGIFRKGIRTPLAMQVAAAMALAEIGNETAGNALLDALDASDREAGPWIGGAVAHWQRLVAQRKNA
jgi:hypothetical protein